MQTRAVRWLRRGLAGVFGGLVLVASTTPPVDAVAQPRVSTSYRYFAVKGATSLSLLRDLHRNGPTVNGNGAYAYTQITPRPTGTLRQGATCRSPDFRLNMHFTITLPAARQIRSASASTRSAWQSFTSFARRHEERHRAIWIACASRIETRIHALAAPDCDTFQTRATGILSSEYAACSRRHDAFDRAEQARLVRLPIFRRALGRVAVQ